MLPSDLMLAFQGIGMREVGREAEHGRDLSRFRQSFANRLDVRERQALEEAVVVLESLRVERGGLTDPVKIIHRAVVEFVEVALRKNADARCGGVVHDDWCDTTLPSPRTAVR